MDNPFEEITERLISIEYDLKDLTKYLKYYQEKKSQNPDILFNLPEAAKYCKMAIPTFRLYLAKREVSGIKPGKSWKFTQQDLDNFLNKYRCKTVDELREEAENCLYTKKGGNK
ncbi:helix-turn-helix domain-containing protein [Bacteroidota bacterium]